MTEAREFLAAVQARADAATDGPWEAVERAGVYIPFPWGAVKAHVETDANAEFIAAARADVPRLVAALTAALDHTQFPMAVTDDYSDGYNAALRDMGVAIEGALANGDDE